MTAPLELGGREAGRVNRISAYAAIALPVLLLSRSS